jgi:hypothetical protein
VTANRELVWRCRCTAASAKHVSHPIMMTTFNAPILVAAPEQCRGVGRRSRGLRRCVNSPEQRTEEGKGEEEEEEGRVSFATRGKVDVGINGTLTGLNAVVAIN